MAQTLYDGVVENPSILGSASVTGLAGIHEPAGATPYIGVFMAAQSVGETDLNPPAGAGRLRIVLNYSDNTSTEVAMDDDPFSEVPSIPKVAPLWLVVRGNGKVRQFGSGRKPTSASVLAQSSSPAANERLPAASGKTLVNVTAFWTDD